MKGAQMASEVAEWIEALRDGSTSIEEVAEKFRRHHWPRRQSSDPSTTPTAMSLADPDPYIPGSFDDVTAAYNSGLISEEYYDVLARAMAESKLAEDTTNDGQK